jgi:hypothetical protein
MALSGVEGSFDKLTTPSEAEGPQEYQPYFEDFEPKPDNEFVRQPKFCNGLFKDAADRHRPCSKRRFGVG